jgi:hypothetical protein
MLATSVGVGGLDGQRISRQSLGPMVQYSDRVVGSIHMFF